jgi:hypothetical protein
MFILIFILVLHQFRILYHLNYNSGHFPFFHKYILLTLVKDERRTLLPLLSYILGIKSWLVTRLPWIIHHLVHRSALDDQCPTWTIGWVSLGNIPINEWVQVYFSVPPLTHFWILSRSCNSWSKHDLFDATLVFTIAIGSVLIRIHAVVAQWPSWAPKEIVNLQQDTSNPTTPPWWPS